MSVAQPISIADAHSQLLDGQVGSGKVDVEVLGLREGQLSLLVSKRKTHIVTKVNLTSHSINLLDLVSVQIDMLLQLRRALKSLLT